LAISPVQQS